MVRSSTAALCASAMLVGADAFGLSSAAGLRTAAPNRVTAAISAGPRALRGGSGKLPGMASRGAALSMSSAVSVAESTSPATTSRLTPENAMEMIDSVDVFIFDCDGVIWKGDTLIAGVEAILDKLRALGKKVFFVTNNSTKSRKGYKSKFDSLGMDVNPEEIFSSSFAAAAYLEQTNFKATGKEVYIVGERGIEEELDLIGIPWSGGEQDATKTIELKSGYALPHNSNVGAVIVGFDRFINYYKIQYAQLCINENPGCQFIATNLDAVTHLTDAQEWAGNGAMAGAIKGCTGQEPLVVGKPSPLMIDYLADKFGVVPSKICMVGDRLDTDVVFGNSNGCKSVLVYSGVTTEEKYFSPDNKIKANYYVDSIADFFKF
mmetsp:Transcript_46680/g.111136  ORF Transcript_46680/g.111136 Transcript_46680/m.111136 type:complete len:377 (-) Transcript_46680:73-1203(-)